MYKRQSLSNAMEEIQKDFNETYPDVEILYNADSSGTLQTPVSYTHLDVYKRQSYDFTQLTDEELLAELEIVDDRRIWKIAEAIRRGMPPVSYTHLDVYKRQHLQHGIRSW